MPQGSILTRHPLPTRMEVTFRLPHTNPRALREWGCFRVNEDASTPPQKKTVAFMGRATGPTSWLPGSRTLSVRSLAHHFSTVSEDFLRKGSLDNGWTEPTNQPRGKPANYRFIVPSKNMLKSIHLFHPVNLAENAYN